MLIFNSYLLVKRLAIKLHIFQRRLICITKTIDVVTGILLLTKAYYELRKHTNVTRVDVDEISIQFKKLFITTSS